MNYSKCILFFVLPILLHSCIREDFSDCPAPGRIEVIVEDKNYDNITSLGLIPLTEDLPMLSYVDPLLLWWYNAATPTYRILPLVMERSESTHLLNITPFPPGVNQAVIVGNGLSTGVTDGRDVMWDLHRANNEG